MTELVTNPDQKKYAIKRIIIGNELIKVYLENENISISLEDYYQYDLKNRKDLDEDLYRELKQKEKLSKAYQSCLRKLSMKDHTIKQIRDHLLKKDLAKEEIDRIILKLKEYNLLNDEKYCQNKIVSYENENLSYNQIRQRLIKDGVHEELIRKYLQKDEDRENEKVEKLAEKYARTVRNKSLNSTKSAIISKLVNSGFSFSDSKDAVDKLQLENQNEVELLRKEYEKALLKYRKKYVGYELKQRLISNLLQKGFSYDDIREILEDGYDEKSD